MGMSRKIVSATPRQLESLIRLAEAQARMRLSPEVTVGDVGEAVRLMKVAMQQSSIDPRTGQIDMDVIQTGACCAGSPEGAGGSLVECGGVECVCVGGGGEGQVCGGRG